MECPQDALYRRLRVHLDKYKNSTLKKFLEVFPANLILKMETQKREDHLNRFGDNEVTKITVLTLIVRVSMYLCRAVSYVDFNCSIVT